MNGAQALFKARTDAGFDTCFANPGTSEMHLVYEMGRTDWQAYQRAGWIDALDDSDMASVSFERLPR